MVKNEKYAVKSVHHFLIRGRIMTSEAFSNEEMFNFFDDLEYLVALILEDNDTTKQFESYLFGMSKTYKAPHIKDLYLKEQP